MKQALSGRRGGGPETSRAMRSCGTEQRSFRPGKMREAPTALGSETATTARPKEMW
jgi:hypothetical protein